MTRLCLLLALAAPAYCQFAAGIWKTDKSKKNIDLAELLSGGPPKDGIPSIDHPRFVPPAEATWLSPKELVIALELEGEARAYPLQILMWHELVNDAVGGLPVLVSYCPLCNSAIVFDRKIGSATLEFGVSGMLRNSDMVMYDRQTDSLWQQITGEGIVGEHTGKALAMLPSQMISFEDFTRTYPKGVVLSRETGVVRDYGRNPYQGYEFNNRPIMPVRQRRQTSLKPMDKLIVIKEKRGFRAYPVKALAERGVWEDKVDGQPIVLLYSPEGLSPVDATQMPASRAAGSVGVFTPGKGRVRFRRDNGRILDRETASTWAVTGVAIDGKRKGEKIDPVPHGVYFSFAWLAFEPDTKLMGVSPGEWTAQPDSR